eukprot:TRINITY_DN62288_c0_g1_i1.p1 TRINITY_DN62288_c0_g1~~TRINITY_DN62288_c0_g1_i1.p1  ORF type:complete len:1106 (+),score=205.33 TRINITY_DN62288_c0_g1_i1:77-3319(+)
MEPGGAASEGRKGLPRSSAIVLTCFGALGFVEFASWSGRYAVNRRRLAAGGVVLGVDIDDGSLGAVGLPEGGRRLSDVPNGRETLQWECLTYAAGQDDAWCEHAHAAHGVQYKFHNNVSNSPCKCKCCSAEAEEHAAGEHADHTSSAFSPVVFFLVTYFLSAVSMIAADRLPAAAQRLPHTVVLFLLGMGLAWICSTETMKDTELGIAMTAFQTLDPHVIFWILLPPLLYEDSSSVHWHVMQRCLPSALLLAIPGVILNCVLTAVFVRYTFLSSDWEMSTALLLGSILSATDPVAVVGALHELQAPDKLSSLIAGESLFNDGSAVVLFNLFKDLCKIGAEPLEAGSSIVYFLRLALGGPVVGIFAAAFAFVFIKLSQGNFQVEMLIIVIAVWGIFFISEHHKVQVSGVLAVVVFGFFIAAKGHFSLSRDKVHEHHAIIGFLALLANEMIFVVGGLVAFHFIVHNSIIQGFDWLELGWLYVIIHITRTVTVLVFSPILAYIGYGLTWKEAVILIFGGLRGAVGLAMALMVVNTTLIEQAARERIAFHVSGIVLLTLVVNGIFVTPLYQKLAIYPRARRHAVLLQRGLMLAEIESRKHIQTLAGHWFFHNCLFTEVTDLVPDLAEIAGVEKSFDERMTKTVSTPSDLSCRVQEIDLALNAIEGLGRNELKENMQKLRLRNLQKLSTSIGRTNSYDRLMQKLRVLTSHGGDKNFMIAKNVMEETKKRKNAVDIALTYEKMYQSEVPSKDSDAHQRVVARWKSAFHRVNHMLNTIKRVQSPLQKSAEAVALDPVIPADSLNDLDVETMAEVFQVVLNAARVAYQQMFDDYTLDSAAFRMLEDSLDFGEEACAGELANYEFLTRDEGATTRMERTNSNLHSADHETQCKRSIMVTWQALKCHVGEGNHEFAFGGDRRWYRSLQEFLSRHFQKTYRKAEWRKMTRDVDAILAYIMVHQQLLSELPVFEQFPQVKQAVQETLQIAKGAALFDLSRKYRGMFTLYEHMLCAKLSIQIKREVLKQMSMEGSMQMGEVHEIASQSLDPALNWLRNYTPTALEVAPILIDVAALGTVACIGTATSIGSVSL